MKKAPKYSPEFRERAVRLVFEHQEEHNTSTANRSDDLLH
jgi:hypothetical protein